MLKTLTEVGVLPELTFGLTIEAELEEGLALAALEIAAEEKLGVEAALDALD